MKPIVAILGLVVAAAAGALGGFVASSTSTTPQVESNSTAHVEKQTAAPIPAASPLVDNSDLTHQLTDLTNEVARLRSELASVRDGRVREPAIAKDPTKATEETPAESLAILHKDAILRVIAEDRADQLRKEDEARKQRELEQATQRAERVGKELNLSTTEQRKLAEVFVMEREKRDEFMRNMRNGDVPDREQMRTSFQEYRDWRTNELTTRLGADLAAKVNEMDGDRMGFGGRAFGGDMGGGNNNGGGGRRTRATGGTNGAPPTGGGQGGG